MPEGDPTKGTVLMAACRHGENLDTHPDFPADLFTSCLTTPVKVNCLKSWTALMNIGGNALVIGTKLGS